MTVLGVIFPPDLPPERLKSVAQAAEGSGLEQLWVWEDCFSESGIAAATAALAWTERLVIGIGLLPVPLRNVALTAMELATVARLFPGRIVPGIGHGVLDWMGQTGTRVESPMTLLREYAVALRALLHGETVTSAGRYVQLDDVTLAWPPNPPPPLLIGAVGPKTVSLSGELGDGTIFTGEATPASLRESTNHISSGRQLSGRSSGHDVVVFMTVADRPEAGEVAARIGEFVDAGATHMIMLSVGEAADPLEDFARFIARDVRPLVD